MKKYKFLRPFYIEGIDFAMFDEPFILQVGDDKHWLTLNDVEVYLTDKMYNELISKNIIELI